MLEKDYVVIKLDEETRGLFRETVEKESILDLPENIKKALEDDFQEPLRSADLLWIRGKLPRDKHLHEILSRCEVVLPQLKVEPRNPELEARIQKLRKAEEERQYRVMTKNVDSVRVRHPEDTFAAQGNLYYSISTLVSKN